MRRLLAMSLVALLTGLPAWGQNSVELLKEQAEKADGKKEISLSVKIAEQQLKAANAAYDNGKTEEALEAVQDVLEYSTRAAKESTETGKKMKHTEIALRKIADKLEDIRKSLAVDDRPPVAEAIRKIEAARNDLLFRMFK